MENTENLDVNKVSAHNEGWLQIQRLHDCWIKANYNSCNGKLVEWRWLLDVIFRELSRDYYEQHNFSSMEDFFDDDFIKEILQIDRKIIEANKVHNKRELYDALKDKDVRLRILQGKIGKGGKYLDDDVGSL